MVKTILQRKWLVSAICFMLTFMLLVCAVTIDSYAIYSPGKAAQYALDNTVDSGVTKDAKTKRKSGWRNPDYYSSGYDCTNFVSQCVVAGGKSFINPKKLDLTAKGWLKGAMYTDTTSRWYNKKYTYSKGPLKKTIFCYSTSFNQVGKFYTTWKKYQVGGTYKKSGKSPARAKNSALQNALRIGDIIQVYESGEGWHHSMIVTSGKKGNWKVTYHSTDTKDQPLYTRQFKDDAQYRVIRIK